MIVQVFPIDEYDETAEPGLPQVIMLTKDQTAVKPLDLDELIAEQGEDVMCQQFVEQTQKPHSPFKMQANGLLVRQSPKDGAIQTVIPETLQPRVLYLAHYPLLAGHPKSTKMYETMRRQYYWPRMMEDVTQTAKDCRECAEARGTRYKSQKPMKLFPARKPLEFIAMDLLGPFPATESGSTNILVITDRFSKLAQVTPLSSTTAPAVANAFIEHWVIPYGLPAFLLSDNGPQFVGKFFEAICLTLKVKHVATTAYHPQTNGQTERYNQTLATRLRIFTDSNNKDWDRLIQPFTYAYNTQVHRTTGETPFSHVLTRPPPNVVAPPADTMPTSEPLTPEEAKLKVMERTKALVTQAAKTTEERQKKYKAYHDKRLRSQLILEPGDEVFLNTPPTLGQTPAERMADGTKGKLRKKTLAAFKVLEAYESTAKIVGADGIEDIVSLDRLTKAPPPLDPQTLKPATQSQSSPTRTPTRVRFAEPAQSGGLDNAESQEQTTLKASSHNHRRQQRAKRSGKRLQSLQPLLKKAMSTSLRRFSHTERQTKGRNTSSSGTATSPAITHGSQQHISPRICALASTYKRLRSQNTGNSGDVDVAMQEGENRTTPSPQLMDKA